MLPRQVNLALIGVATTLAAWSVWVKLQRRYAFVPKFTILADLHNLGKRRKDGKFRGRAIVCGGSVAGLLTAAVCANHFESVLIIEPEEWANQHGHAIPENRELKEVNNGYFTPVSLRTRVSQYWVVHFLEPPVYMVLNGLFPTLRNELGRCGYRPNVLKIKLRYGGVYVEDPFLTNDPDSGAPLSLSLTRDAYETMLRRLVKTTLGNVEIRTATVTGFKSAEDGSNMLRGVTLRDADGNEKDEYAAFVVDATGPSQLAFTKGLNRAGFPLPADLRAEYDPHMRYTTSTWTVPPHLHDLVPMPWGYQPGVLYNHPPDQTTGERRAFYGSVVEHDQMQLTCGGWDIDDHPHSIGEIRTFVQTLNGSDQAPRWIFDLFDFLEEHQDECKPFYADAAAGTLNWVQYHNAKLPTNFAAVGDSVMKLNPVYGQGITMASVAATTLDAALREVPSHESSIDVATKYFLKLLPRIEGTWEATKANDYGFSTTIPAKGEDLGHGEAMRKVGRDLILLGRKDPDVYATWWHVNMMLAPATDLFAPWVMRRMTGRWWPW